ncbi:hypothetical protein [Nocardia transvalensis]|uniref:hypothetical protein n=1 Tax=Nocardia transvalensis TaxID=37333 RepID=UPI0018958CCA|nr:hypothetical protein [Nocardia transvalensis]MBF6332913.1 hypothetical protein [Nocardia transvalensis]
MAGTAPLAAALIALPAAPAQAAEGDLRCSASVSIAFQPPLVAGGRSDAQIGGNLRDCTSPNGRNPDLTSGTLAGSGSATATPNIFLPCGVSPSGNGTGTITWSTGATSTVSWEVSGMTFSATVTDGKLAGDAITAAVNGLPQTTCGPQGGLANATVPATVAFD